MKKLLCPLCGEMPEYIEFGCGDGESDLIQCNCGLCTSAGSYPNGEENCWKDWEKLVSKFPPIMRVWPGDKVKLFGEKDHWEKCGPGCSLSGNGFRAA